MGAIHTTPGGGRENNPTRKVRAIYGSTPVLERAGGVDRSNQQKLPLGMDLAVAAGAIHATSSRGHSAPNRMRKNTMKMAAIQAVSMVSAVTMIGFAATAHAGGPPQSQSYQFQNSSGNIACMLSSTGAACEINAHTYTPSTPPPACTQHSAWGDRFLLPQGATVQMPCHNDTLHVPGEQVLDDGQTLSAGTLSCTSDAATMRCTDSSTGHFFYISPGSYQLG